LVLVIVKLDHDSLLTVDFFLVCLCCRLAK